ncbi:MAG: aminotransferase class V-fold PLP-dependent enzyme [Bacteroidaceae bacterium]|nr:aminotransferase class V-fold PLP-dependent enzyme [Bacteroidaceae bacterium]
MNNKTKAIHTPFALPDAYGALSMPVYHTAAYEFENAAAMADAFCGRSSMPDYSRVTNPTVTFFEDKIKSLTAANDVVAFSSGMAAISNVFLAVAGAGRNIVTSKHVFGNTFALLNTTLHRFGVEAKYVDLTCEEQVAAAVDENTCCIYLEIMTNPHLEVANLSALAAIARRHDIPLIVDSTAIPFTETQLSELGVDVEIVSSTKYLSGGATSIGGVVIDYGRVEGFSHRLRSELLLNIGAYMTPHVAYMQTIGIETLHVRYKLQASNALELAQRLRTVPGVVAVNYVGLPDNPYHSLSRQQFGPTAGAMLTFDLADEAACMRCIDRLKLVRRATNLFDNKTLAIHPYSTIFGNFSIEQRRAMDIHDTTIRISVGLEDVDDIFEDLKQAIQ